MKATGKEGGREGWTEGWVGLGGTNTSIREGIRRRGDANRQHPPVGLENVQVNVNLGSAGGTEGGGGGGREGWGLG